MDLAEQRGTTVREVIFIALSISSLALSAALNGQEAFAQTATVEISSGSWNAEETYVWPWYKGSTDPNDPSKNLDYLKTDRHSSHHTWARTMVRFGGSPERMTITASSYGGFKDWYEISSTGESTLDEEGLTTITVLTSICDRQTQ